VVPPRRPGRRTFLSTTNKRVGKLSKFCSKYRVLLVSKLSDDGESSPFWANSGGDIAKPIKSVWAGVYGVCPDLFERPVAALEVAILA
jgi:hypothetical protein